MTCIDRVAHSNHKETTLTENGASISKKLPRNEMQLSASTANYESKVRAPTPIFGRSSQGPMLHHQSLLSGGNPPSSLRTPEVSINLMMAKQRRRHKAKGESRGSSCCAPRVYRLSIGLSGQYLNDRFREHNNDAENADS